MPKMQIIDLVVGPLETNCYVLVGDGGQQSAVIDPGGDEEDILGCCRRLGAEVLYIVNTHGHGDHIGANRPLKENYPQARLCVGEIDAEMLASPLKNLSAVLDAGVTSPPADLLLTEGQMLQVGGTILEVLHTPGHTPGAISLLARDAKPPVLFAGDLIFAGGVGRTDIPGGDIEALQDSIRTKVFTLPGETVILPGHGPRTAVGIEKETNPFVGSNAIAQL